MNGAGAFAIDGVVVVTGAAMGIGAGIADMLAEAGATVIVADLDGDKAAAKARGLTDRGLAAHAVQVDVGDEASILSAFTAIAAFGPLWGIVANAGLVDRQMLLDGTAEEWDRINAVNARGAFLLTREAGGRWLRLGVAGGSSISPRPR